MTSAPFSLDRTSTRPAAGERRPAAGKRRPADSGRRLRHGLLVLLAALGTLASVPRAAGQRPVDFGLTYTQERTKFVGSGTDPYFMIRGATADLGYGLYGGLGLAVSGEGTSTVNLRGFIDQEQVSFTAGPRYTWNWGHITPTATSRKGGLFVQGKVGYTLAFAGQFPVNGVLLDRASALTYTGGGGVNLHIYQRFDLRLAEVDYIRTQLPNGGTNVQNTLKFATGLNFHFGL